MKAQGVLNTPYDGLFREAPPETGTFFQASGIERVGKSVFLSLIGPKRINRRILWI